MLLWLAVGGALAGSLARWRLAEARHDRAAATVAAERQARRRRRGRARITRLEATGATLLGMPAVRVHVEVDLAIATAVVDAGLAAAVEPPAWFHALHGPAAAAYASLVPGLVRQALADPERGALDPLPAAAHGELVDRAIVAAHAHDDGLVHLVALASCVHAARAGALTVEQRVYASELVRQYAGTGHPIDLLAPSYFALFGLRAAARDRLRALRGRTAAFRSVESPYHAWLARRFA